jgi:hypothetical protein
VNELRRAVKLYRDFREATPRTARRVSLATPKAMARMGVLEFIGYMTTHGGKPALYVHHFAPGSRPAIYAGVHRNQVALYGGRFYVTGRGFTDLDARGREVDYTPKFVTVNRSEWLKYQSWRARHRRGNE